jgi:hypothetical protein
MKFLFGTLRLVFATSVAAALIEQAGQSDRTAYVCQAEGDYASLGAQARAIAAALKRFVGPGKRALLLCPSIAWLRRRLPRMFVRRSDWLLAIFADAGRRLRSADTSWQRVRGWLERTPGGAALSLIANDELDLACRLTPLAPDREVLASSNQYSSGSSTTRG